MNIFKQSTVLVRRQLFLLCVLTSGALLPATAQASLFLGSFTTFGSVNISTDLIHFTDGYLIAPGASGDFASLTPYTPNDVPKDIANPPYSVGTVAATPDFMTFVGVPNISFTLDKLLPGEYSSTSCFAAAGSSQTCTLPGAPYNLANGSSSNGAILSTASFTVNGTEIDAITGETAAFSGLFTASFSQPYQDTLSTVLGGSSIDTSYSGSFVVQTSTPEPRMFIPVGLGLLCIGAMKRFLRLFF